MSSGSNASSTMLARLQQFLHPVVAFAAKLNFLRSSEAVTAQNSASTLNTNSSNANAIAPQQKGVTPQSGETISFSLPVVLNVGKTLTIKYDATINVPPGAAFVQTQGSVSGSGFAPVLTKDQETGTAVPRRTDINTNMSW